MAGSIKYRQVSGGADGGDHIHCRPTKQHVIDYAVAQRLHQGGIAGLLPFSFVDEGKQAELFYFTDGLLTLRQALDGGLSFLQVSVMLKGAISTLESCVSLGMPTQNIDFDPSRVLLRPADLRLMFIYLPLQNYQPGAYDIRSLLLLVVAESKPADANERAQSVNLLNHLKQQSLFSLIDLKDFLGLGGKRGIRTSERLTTGSKIAKPPRRVRDFVHEGGAAAGAASCQGDARPPDTHPPDNSGAGAYALVRVSDNATWRIEGASLVLGRISDQQTLKVSDSSSVGRAHARIFLHQGRCYLADNSSKNGTYMNGRRLTAQKPVEVADGSTVVLGSEQFVIRAL
jgi:hypothetical protein